MQNKQTMRKLLQTIFLSFILILAISVSATANNGGDDGVKTHQTNNDIRVYPNPATNQLIIEGIVLDRKEIRIFNTLGQEFQNIKLIDNTTIDVTNLPTGMYFLKLNTGTKKFYKK